MFFKECFRGLSYLLFSLMTLVQKICVKTKVVGVKADKRGFHAKIPYCWVTLKHVVIQNGMKVYNMKITRISAINPTF